MLRSQRSRTPACIKVTAVALLAVACSALARDRDERFDARLKSFREVPAVSSTATGRFRAVLDEKEGKIEYALSYSGLEGQVTQAHIHLGQRGVNGGIMVWLCQTAPPNTDPTGMAPPCPESGTVRGEITLANVIGGPPPEAAGAFAQGVAAREFEEFVAAMRAGVAYANVHSTKFPGGELRGQVIGDDD
jgi:CHRD domain